jgi:hypothetical protein
MSIVLVSKNLYVARSVLKSAVDSKIEISPYFNENFAPDARGDMTFFPRNVQLIIASYYAERALGTNVVSASLDETNFVQTNRQQIKVADGGKQSLANFDRAELTYRSLKRRIKSRFLQAGGEMPGMIVLVSSANTVGSFIERRIEEAATERDGSVYCYEAATWSVKPPGSFSGKTFRVLCGGNSTLSRILAEGEEVAPDVLVEDTRIIDVPDEYREDFEGNLEDAIRDVAGIPTTAISRFFQRPERITEAVRDDWEHPCSLHSWRFGDALSVYWNKLCRKIIRRLPGGYEEDAWVPRIDPKELRYIHIDTSLSGDATGIAMGHVARWVEVVRRGPDGVRHTEWAPHFVIDLLLQVMPPLGEQIQLADIRAFIYNIMDHGFRLIGFSTDSYQCLVGDTRVTTRRGMIRLRDVVPGDLVVSRTGVRRVLNAWSFGFRKTLRIVTADGDVIEGTDRHRIEVWLGYAGIGGRGKMLGPVWKKKSGKVELSPVYEWRTIGELKIGDRVRMWRDPLDDGDSDDVAMSSLSRIVYGSKGVLTRWNAPAVMTVDLAEFLGVAWANGAWDEDGIRISSDVRDVDDVERIAAACFEEAVLGKTNVDGNRAVLCLSGRHVIRWLADNGFDKRVAPDVIPEAIWLSSSRVKGAFLRGLFSGDGNVNTSTGGCSLSTKWRTLAEETQRMLRMTWGIPSCLVTIQRGYEGDYVKTGEQYVVAVRGSREVFAQAVGMAYQRKHDDLEVHRGRPGRDLWTTVAEIHESEGDVYDIEVEGDPSYVANGFVSHNSADMLQQMRRKGVAADLVSVDRTMEPYETLRSAFYERRIEMYRHEGLLGELRALEHNRERGKVDHPVAGKKDLADALAGVVYGMTVKSRRLPVGVVHQGEPSAEDDMRWVTGATSQAGEDGAVGAPVLPFLID